MLFVPLHVSKQYKSQVQPLFNWEDREDIHKEKYIRKLELLHKHMSAVKQLILLSDIQNAHRHWHQGREVKNICKYTSLNGPKINYILWIYFTNFLLLSRYLCLFRLLRNFLLPASFIVQSLDLYTWSPRKQ